MAYVPAEYREQLDLVSNLRVFHAQDGALRRLASAQAVLSVFFVLCEAAHRAHVGGDSTAGFPPQQFLDPLVEQLAAALLHVPYEPESGLWEHATREVSAPQEIVDPIRPLADAELRLRRLEMLCIRCAGNWFRGETRDPQWDRLFDESLGEFEAAVARWESMGALPTLSYPENNVVSNVDDGGGDGGTQFRRESIERGS